MPSHLVVVRDSNVTPGWVSKVLEEVLDLPTTVAQQLATSLIVDGEIDLSSHSLHVVDDAMVLARYGLDVRLRSQ